MNSIKAIVNILVIDLAEIAAFGDDYNDEEMIEQCGYGVAVSNANEQVLMSARYIAKSNEEDGVVKFIEENLL